MNLKFKRLHEAAQLPTRATPTDSGMDLYAVEDAVLLPGVPTLVRSCLARANIHPPALRHLDRKPGLESWALKITFEAQIRPRSGLALKHGIQVLNSPGTVDNAYRGPIGVIRLWSGHAPNAWAWQKQGDLGVGGYKHYNEFTDGEKLASGVIHPYAYKVRKGDRIAQLVIAPVVLCVAEWADELGETDRGDGGFGSTGVWLLP